MSWVARAKVGDKVAAIEGVWNPIYGNPAECEPFPVTGRVYTIRALELFAGEIMFVIEELEHDVVFSASGFRPVRDTTLQVEAIKRAALDVPAKSPETVA